MKYNAESISQFKCSGSVEIKQNHPPLFNLLLI